MQIDSIGNNRVNSKNVTTTESAAAVELYLNS